ncbi:MAG TPA: hypothetical protein VGQ12_07750 [Candidatus Angelobacter sp.]|jgi:hypothetical protein|nr:hypothetical protein [Candidatus Angelobacter sp.]
MKRTSLAQLLILLQAVTLIGLGISLVGPLTSAASQFLSPLFIIESKGSGVASAVFFSSLPQAILRCLIAVAALWWLSEQKRIVAAGEGETLPRLSLRAKLIVCAVFAVAVSIGIFLIPRTVAAPPVVFEERDIQSSPK